MFVDIGESCLCDLLEGDPLDEEYNIDVGNLPVNVVGLNVIFFFVYCYKFILTLFLVQWLRRFVHLYFLIISL